VLIITNPVYVNGSVIFPNSTTITIGATITASGCIGISPGSSLQVNYNQPNSSAPVLLLSSGSNCLSGAFETVTANSNDECLEVMPQVNQTTSSLSVLFGVRNICEPDGSDPLTLSNGAIAGIVIGS